MVRTSRADPRAPPTSRTDPPPPYTSPADPPAPATSDVEKKVYPSRRVKYEEGKFTVICRIDVKTYNRIPVNRTMGEIWLANNTQAFDARRFLVISQDFRSPATNKASA
ncbi:hypothetical protein PoB_003992500 [Plakobranchus ocellatus]|uniref:Uncharacterized protein n=1 Tax=Plakobranchus ocellatus TaxID=259542 RepID=A0AAV4AYG9_9GAST|nr:hypothetical protein PoB_003992500 [Plakobranchus ocellatus]